MKARIKATGEIIEVIYSHTNYYNGHDILWYKTSQGYYFTKGELEFITTEDDLDYWIRLEHQAAIAAMQGLVTRGEVLGSSTQAIARDIAEISCEIAHALVEKMKEERK